MTEPLRPVAQWFSACCDLHGRNCEPPSELCCPDCTEADHPGHRKRGPCSNPDLSPAIVAAYAQANPAVGVIVRPEAVHDRVRDGRISQTDPQLLALLDMLAEIYDRWTTEAQRRQQGASNSQLFGPKMMILQAEGSVLLGCADELRAAVLKFGESQSQSAHEHSGRPANICRRCGVELNRPDELGS